MSKPSYWLTIKSLSECLNEQLDRVPEEDLKWFTLRDLWELQTELKWLMRHCDEQLDKDENDAS